MVYRRKYKRIGRKIGQRKKSYKKSYKKKGPMRFIPKQSPIEKKYIDTTFTAQSVDNAGTITLLNGTQHGTSNQQRIGEKISIKNIEISGVLGTNGTNVYSAYAKIMLVYDKQPNASTFSLSNLINTIGGVYLPWSTRNSTYASRFVVLKNFYVNLTLQGSTSVNAPTEKGIRCYKKCNVPVQYNGGNVGDITDISTGALYAVFMSDRSSTYAPYFSGSIRLRFSDD